MGISHNTFSILPALLEVPGEIRIVRYSPGTFRVPGVYDQYHTITTKCIRLDTFLLWYLCGKSLLGRGGHGEGTEIREKKNQRNASVPLRAYSLISVSFARLLNLCSISKTYFPNPPIADS
jgi:hypothetical protein